MSKSSWFFLALIPLIYLVVLLPGSGEQARRAVEIMRAVAEVVRVIPTSALPHT